MKRMVELLLTYFIYESETLEFFYESIRRQYDLASCSVEPCWYKKSSYLETNDRNKSDRLCDDLKNFLDDKYPCQNCNTLPTNSCQST